MCFCSNQITMAYAIRLNVLVNVVVFLVSGNGDVGVLIDRMIDRQIYEDIPCPLCFKGKVLEIVFSDTDLIVLVQGIVVVDDGVLVAALLIDAAVLGVVVRCLANLFLNLDDQEDLRINFYL